MPPPSNEEADPALPELGVATPEHAALPIEPDTVGLKPPELSSTAPNGIPVGSTGARGEVAPIAGEGAMLTCAKLGPLWKSATIVMAINKRVFVSTCSFRIVVHRSFKVAPG
jgi:hypothetical protein